MKRLAILITTLVLTACGGGGGGTGAPTAAATNLSAQPFSCVEQLQKTPGRYRAAVFDTRRDEFTYTADGLQTTGFEATKLMIDRARCVGFDTIVFQTNVPIDTATGLIRLQLNHQNLSIPRDFWRYITYAKSLGITVGVRMIPVDYTNDHTIMDYHRVPVEPFFASIQDYIVDAARISEANGVDFFYVGSYQVGLDTQPYERYWQSIIDSVRAVYRGRLTYATGDRSADNVVWQKVDFASVGWSSWSAMRNVALQFDKPIFIDDLNPDATSAPGYMSPTWMMVENFTITMANLDYEAQRQKIRDFFYRLDTDFKGETLGFSFGQYMPWIQQAEIQTNPKSAFDVAAKTFDTVGNSMYNNISAQTTIQSYLSKPWN